MDRPIELTLEQQLQLRIAKDQVENMPLDQARNLLIELYTLMLARETMYRQLFRQEWENNPINFPGDLP